MKPLELSSEHFGALAADVVALSVEYLSTLDARPIFPRTSGAETEQLFAGEAPEHGMGDQAFDALREVIAHSRAQNGRFFWLCLDCRADRKIPTNGVVGKMAFPNAYEVKTLSPHHRLVIAIHSPDEIAETGLRVCPPEKKAAKSACGVRRDTFSGAV